MKKGLSVFMACMLMITTVLSLFSGCSAGAETADKMFNSEWLYLINQSFGFDNYSNEEPYISSITSENSSFDDVQIAFEYSVLPEGYADLDLEKELTREFCALTLSGAIYIPNTNEISIADSDTLNFPESVITVINEGIMSLDENGKFNPQDTMSYNDAVDALEKAYNSWVDHRFDHQISYTLSDSVIDFAGLSTVDQTIESGDYSVDSSYVEQQQDWLDNNNFNYDSVTGTVTIDNIEEKEIKEGSILALPESLDHPSGLYIKVTKIDKNTDAGTNKYTLATELATLEEIFPDGFSYQGVDYANFEKAVIYDANGNILSAGRFGSDNDEISTTPMVNYSELQNNASNIAKPIFQNVSNNVYDDPMSGIYENIDNKPSSTLKIPVGTEGSAEVKITPENGKLTASVKYEKGNNSLTFEKKFENFEIINKTSIDLRDYMKVGMKYDVTDKVTFKHSIVDKKGYKLNKGTSPQIDYEDIHVQRSLSELGNLMDDIAKYASQDIEASPTVARILMPIAPAVSVDMLVKIRFKLDGTIDIAFTFADQEVGIEKRPWSFNLFNMKTPLPTLYYDKGTKTNSSVSGAIKAELTVGLNFAACIASVNIIDIEPAVGVGLEMSGKLNYINESKQPILDEVLLRPNAIEAITYANIFAITSLTDTENTLDDASPEEYGKFMACFETNVYPILKISACTSDSLIGKYITSFSMEFMDSESTPIFKSHAEWDPTGFHWQECTLSDIIDDGIEHGDHIEISPMADAFMNIDDEFIYDITMLPETKKKIYTLSDLVIETTDRMNEESVDNVTITQNFAKTKTNKKNGSFFNNILNNLFGTSANDNGKDLKDNQFSIKAISPGDSNVVIRTRDNLFSTVINVHVNEPTESVNAAIMLKTYSASVAVNDSLKLSLTYIPDGKNETSVFWQCDNEDIASVDPLTGEIKGLSEGSCIVKAYVPGSENSAAYCMITVTKEYTSTGIVYFTFSDPDSLTYKNISCGMELKSV